MLSSSYLCSMAVFRLWKNFDVYLLQYLCHSIGLGSDSTSIKSVYCIYGHRILEGFFFFKSKITRMALIFAVNDATSPTFCTNLIIIYGRIQWLSFLKTSTTNRCLKIITRKKTRSALGAPKAIHLSLWFPTPEYINHEIVSSWI